MVFLVGPFAVKVPSFYSWQTFLWGLLSNLQERTFSQTAWPELCPVLFSLPGGWLVIMRRAEPLSEATFSAFDYDGFSNLPEYRVPVEHKRDSFGLFDGRIVAVDYGG
jgi:hypothetical protein